MTIFHSDGTHFWKITLKKGQRDSVGSFPLHRASLQTSVYVYNQTTTSSFQPWRLQVIPSQQRRWLKLWQRLILNILATMSACVSPLSQHPAWFMGLVLLPFTASLLRLKGLAGSDVSWSRLFMLTVLLREDQWCISFPFSASLKLLHTCTVSQNTNSFPLPAPKYQVLGSWNDTWGRRSRGVLFSSLMLL